MKRSTTRWAPGATALLAVAAALALPACRHHYGPQTIVQDRLPYNEAIARSWKEQTLLNIVKLRYADTPFFIDVAQVTSGYTIQGQGGVTAGIYPPVSNLASFAQQLGINLNAQGGYQDRPTISYTPQTGAQFIRNLTSPINPGSIMFLLQSGYPADIVFNLTVDSINGVKNRSASGGQIRPADLDFHALVRTLRRAQIEGHVGIRVERDKDNRDSVAFFFQDREIDADLKAALKEARRVLKVDPEHPAFKIVFGAAAANPKEIAILSRSVFRVMQELATYVDVPAEHLASGAAAPLDEPETGAERPLHVLSSCEKPADAFAAVHYEGRWFWIEKGDVHSKRTFSHLLVLLALADTGPKESLPVITIQAN